ncbi:uncharacterized protein LOC103493546 isoform X1 [Cucumis melo]|uniref:Uncharacterized protein LOC103493546 isoform X1 n=2 Tax=Cucumis melo TaxID=3656 RepID=A0A1S3BU32_CUCME|nr:uncharacterized protein LOC103493546 isoform X1 [Cucumis melo]XP_016901277.2 uncharacterized protein LOC103493546 isoform X1 [Cucumis melo]
MAMAEAGFSVGSRFRARDSSPESVVFTLESNYSVFSSTSASVERCSFASDAHDYDCRNSEISLHLEGNIEECKEENNGSDSDPEATDSSVGMELNRLPGKREKMKVEKENSYIDAMNGCQPLNMARNSFSLALKECRDRRTRSEALSNKVDRQRAASLDLNSVTVSSPHLAITRKSSFSPIMSDTSMLQSPAVTSCRPANAEIQKGWNSERVPLHKNYSSKQATTTFLPFSNGRTLPSKWEDAERWIFSPVFRDGVVRSAVPPPQRRPKSKSGPLGFPGIVYNSSYSPGMQMLESSKEVNFVSSPFTPGIIAADGLGVHSSGHEADKPVQNQPCIARSVSVHGCSQTRSESLLTKSVAQNSNGVKNSTTNIACGVSRKDMATQMSPDDDFKSSLEIRPPISIATSSVQPIRKLKSLSCSKSEVRDVEVDGRVTLTRWSKKHKSRIPCKGQVHDKDAEPVICAWDVSDTTRSISKVMREEAKITAWENLQKAKAEAAIRKLEMKLEKKRSSSMDKIIKKLKSAQKRAQEMRNYVLANQMSQVDVSSGRSPQRTSLSGCFTCHAF